MPYSVIKVKSTTFFIPKSVKNIIFFKNNKIDSKYLFFIHKNLFSSFVFI